MNALKSHTITYCLSLPFAEESFPFDQRTLVVKVGGKMFALTDVLEDSCSFNLKCDPERAEELRALYSNVQPGYHMSKVHWNTVEYDNLEIKWNVMKDLIDHSYELVYRSLTKVKKEELKLN